LVSLGVPIHDNFSFDVGCLYTPSEAEFNVPPTTQGGLDLTTRRHVQWLWNLHENVNRRLNKPSPEMKDLEKLYGKQYIPWLLDSFANSGRTYSVLETRPASMDEPSVSESMRCDLQFHDFKLKCPFTLPPKLRQKVHETENALEACRKTFLHLRDDLLNDKEILLLIFHRWCFCVCQLQSTRKT
jgi:hypothetical protein